MQDPGIEALERELLRLRAEFQRQESSLLDTIALRKQMLLEGRPELVVHRKVIAGEYAGMDMKSAMQAYLTARGGGPVRRERMAADLATAGVRLGTPSRHVRNLKITASNNRAVFRYDEANDSISLVSEEKPAHPPPMMKRARGAS